MLWKNEQVQQADLFKRQTVKFIFQRRLSFIFIKAFIPTINKLAKTMSGAIAGWSLFINSQRFLDSEQTSYQVHQTGIVGLLKHL